MPHTGVILILVIGVTLVCSQTSTNPDGAPFFSPSLVRELPLDNSTISSIILLSPWDYADFYWGYIPENVGLISFTVTMDSECNGLSIFLNFPEPEEDLSVSFPCLINGYACWNVDTSYNVFGNETFESFTGTNYNSYRPGKPFYMSVMQFVNVKSTEKRSTTNCSYTIQAANEFNCNSSTALGIFGDSQYCLNYSNVTSNGQTFTGITTSQNSDVQVFRLDVPKNVTWLYTWATAPINDLAVAAAAGFAPVNYYDADEYLSGWCDTLASNTSLYVSILRYQLPLGDFPVYFTVKSSNYDGIPYNISFYWEYCGAAKSGLGDMDTDCSTLNIGFYDLPCSDPVTFTNFQFSAGNYTFNNVPAYNSSADANGAAYAFVDVPFGSYGALNLSCVGGGETYVVYCKGQSCDCSDYAEKTDCDTEDQLQLLSQDLYPGGYWTLGACNGRDQPANVTLIVSGSVIAPPSPSPSPVPSATPGGSSTGEDASSTGYLTPTIMFIVLAALMQLFV